MKLTRCLLLQHSTHNKLLFFTTNTSILIHFHCCARNENLCLGSNSHVNILRKHWRIEFTHPSKIGGRLSSKLCRAKIRIRVFCPRIFYPPIPSISQRLFCLFGDKRHIQQVSLLSQKSHSLHIGFRKTFKDLKKMCAHNLTAAVAYRLTSDFPLSKQSSLSRWLGVHVILCKKTHTKHYAG